MESVELFRQLLGLSAPWTVERVELDVAKGHVEVYVGHAPGQRFACPDAATVMASAGVTTVRKAAAIWEIQQGDRMRGFGGAILTAI